MNKLQQQTNRKRPSRNITLANTSSRQLIPIRGPQVNRTRQPSKISTSLLNLPPFRVSSSRPDHRMQSSARHPIIIQNGPSNSNTETMKVPTCTRPSNHPSSVSNRMMHTPPTQSSGSIRFIITNTVNLTNPTQGYKTFIRMTLNLRDSSVINPRQRTNC